MDGDDDDYEDYDDDNVTSDYALVGGACYMVSNTRCYQ
jgi:hypothetical protein